VSDGADPLRDKPGSSLREERNFGAIRMARIRTFIAVELSKPIRDKAIALQEELARTADEVKWVGPENLHVTLLFLGEVVDREVPNVCRIVNEAKGGGGPFPMTVETLGCFPHPRRPRTIWIGIGEGTQELVRIHDALETPLFDLGYRKEDRRYTPHITLGRVRSDRPASQLTEALTRHAGWKGGEMSVQEIHIMGSELTPQGPIYTVLGRARL
jgi:2'-5' RNA ligase